VTVNRSSSPNAANHPNKTIDAPSASTLRQNRYPWTVFCVSSSTVQKRWKYHATTSTNSPIIRG
jgi:hypothetical protein